MANQFRFRAENFSGLHISNDASYDLESGASPDMLNFKITDGYKLKKRNGFEKVFSAETLRGLWYGEVGGEKLYLAVCGETLFASPSGFDSLQPLDGRVPGEEEVVFFPFYRALYLLTGEGILKFDGEILDVLKPHIPLIMVATPPNGAGVPFEEVNVLTRTVRQTFSPTGEDRFFRPAVDVIDRILEVKIDGIVQQQDICFWDEMSCTIQFLAPPDAGIDNMEITYVIASEDISQRIQNCRYALGFGGANDTRAFLYGNRDFPGMRYHSGVVDGSPCLEYFPESAYTLIGNGAAITSILRHYDRQLIFTEQAAYYSYLDYMEVSDGKMLAAFPVLPLSDERGNLPMGQALLIENEPCTLSSSGLYRWVSSNIRDERNAVLFSAPISSLLQRENKKEAKLFYRRDTWELYLLCGEHLYVYHSLLRVFYYYQVPLILMFCQGEEDLFFGTKEGIFRVGGHTDEGKPIPAYWESRKFFFGDEAKKKDLYRFSLRALADEGGEISVCLRDEEGNEERQNLVWEKTGNGVKTKSYRSKKRNYAALQVRLIADGEEAVHIFGMDFSGKITDRIIKE